MKINLINAVIMFFMFSHCSPNQESGTADVTPIVFADKIQLIGLDNDSIDLSTYKGKTIILNIWATWCKPCIVEMPSLKQMQEELDSEKYVLFLASNESLEKIQKFKNRNNYELNFIHIENSPESLGIYSLPTTFIINNKGELITTETGSKDWSTKASIKEITRLTE